MSNRSIRMTFPSRLGHELAARLDMPVAGARAYALFAHCFTCTKDIFAARRIAATLASLGVAVLRFDFTGLGSSAGEFQHTNFSSNVEDLVRAADHLREHYRAPAIVIGHSLGGAGASRAAKQTMNGSSSSFKRTRQHFGASVASSAILYGFHIVTLRVLVHRDSNN